MEKHALALIAIRPQSLRYSLQALLATLPPLKSVNSVGDAQSMVVVAAVLHPALAVLDIGLLGDTAEGVLEQVRAASPHTRHIVLVDNIEQQRAMEAARADAVLLKGLPAAELLAIAKRLLDQPGEVAEEHSTAETRKP